MSEGSISESLEKVWARIERARAGRSSDAVRLIAVSKTVPAPRIKAKRG